MKTILSILLISCTIVAAPSRYSIKKLPPGMSITIDGYANEWNESFYIDSLHSDDNVLARDKLTPWTPADFQYKLYLAYSSMPTANGSDTGYIYGMSIVIRDPDYIVRTTGWAGSGDNMKINPGGQAQAFYITSDGGAPVLNPSSPYITNRTLFARCRTYGNTAANLPTYEWAMRLDVQDPGAQDSFRMSFGSEEIKTGDSTIFCAIGLEYTGFKQTWSSGPWDNSNYYPTFFLSESTGTSTEKHPISINSSAMNLQEAIPNPFNPSTKISFTMPKVSSNDISINIYDIRGKVIRTLLNHPVTPGNHTIIFDGKNDLGEALTSGIYFCRLKSGTFQKTTKLFLKK